MKKIISSIFIFTCTGIIQPECKEISNNKPPIVLRSRHIIAACAPSTAHNDLDMGNVRTTIHINGDMWWDLAGTANYEVPKGSGKLSLFAGAIWFGGRAADSTIKVAAQTYRQSGSDFWPGPIDTTNTSVDSLECRAYDRQWKLTRQEVFNFINGGAPGPDIINWPGNGNPAFGEDNFLAPFFDRNGDGIYDYNDGDYPKYDFGTSPGVTNRLNGDQTIWWVFNDVGNHHGETGSQSPIGLEIRAQAFAFCSSDGDISNATFYSYEVINRATSILYQTYIGQWTDADLGNYQDDYVGCDVSRNLGYTFNGDDDDNGPTGYGTNLAAVGIDMLQCTALDTGGTLMSKFIYYNNDFSNIGNPATAQQYYNYMDGKWKDNSPVVYGGNGYQTAGALQCNYMFPGNSDPMHMGTSGVDPGFEWTESLPCVGCSNNTPSDRRFLMSTGSFSLFPGSVINLCKAAVWARMPGGIDSSVSALKRADDNIQSFFDNNFISGFACLLTNGIDEVSKIHYSVFPAPANDYFNIHFDKELNIFRLKIFAANGILVYERSAKNASEFRIQTSEWNSGMYYFQLSGDKNKSATGKISIIKD